jgi:hypothetical protein
MPILQHNAAASDMCSQDLDHAIAADVHLLPLLAKLRCPNCQRTISAYTIVTTLEPEDNRRLQQLIAIATHNSLQQWKGLPAATTALVQVSMHAKRSVSALLFT